MSLAHDLDLDAWLKEELLGYINGTVAQGPLIYEGLNEQF